jgi:hypothetical protein
MLRALLEWRIAYEKAVAAARAPEVLPRLKTVELASVI